jgi:hypothetical protein
MRFGLKGQSGALLRGYFDFKLWVREFDGHPKSCTDHTYNGTGGGLTVTRLTRQCDTGFPARERVHFDGRKINAKKSLP